MIKVYVASPYTIGNTVENVRNSVDVGEELVRLGYMPYLPLLNHFWDMKHPHDYEYWMRVDEAWLDSCDVLLRLPGESKGADREVEHAKENYIPVVYDIDELQCFFNADKL